MPTLLGQAGAILEQVVVYQNRDVSSLPDSQLQMIEKGELDWIGLSSPSIARSLASLLSSEARKQIGAKTRLASISPVTTAAAREAGFPIAAEATTYTWDGLFQAMIDARSQG